MTIIGIDLGTTHSACAVWRDGEPQLIPNRLGSFLTPSVVSIDDNGELLIGETAKQRLVSHPDRSASLFKRFMGSEHVMTLAKKNYTAIELSSIILKALKEDAEAYLQEPISQAVVSVPAYFNDLQRKATKTAGELAGLNIERLINEPTAAAMMYGLHQRDDGTRFIILDLGGGTFDVSLVEYYEGVLEVHASSGDNYLGGEDFLNVLAQDFFNHSEIDPKKLSKEHFRRVHYALETAKKALSNEQSQSLVSIIPEQTQAWHITRERFETLSRPLLSRLRLPIERTVNDADIDPSQLDEVILVGGATRMQMVRSLVSKMFRRLPLTTIDPDLVVAMGAAIQAGLKNKTADLEDVVLTDVSPYTLGVEIINHNDAKGTQGGRFLPIIERNNTVPVSIEKTLSTTKDNQTQVEINIYQGESRLVKNNVLLGNLSIGVPRNLAGHETVDVRYSYDMNGLLEVDVKVCSTGEKHSKSIVNSAGSLSEEELEASRQKLAKLKFHPRETEQARTLLARAERLYESSLGDLREYISDAISHFEHVLDSQKAEEIRIATKRFTEFLESLENQRLF